MDRSFKYLKLREIAQRNHSNRQALITRNVAILYIKGHKI